MKIGCNQECCVLEIVSRQMWCLSGCIQSCVISFYRWMA